MNRSKWAGGWKRRRLKWCEECGHIILSADGKCHESHYKIKGDRIAVEPIEMVANPTVRWNDINRRRFNVLDRSRERMAAALIEQEDGAAFRMMLAAEQTQRLPLDWDNNEER